MASDRQGAENGAQGQGQGGGGVNFREIASSALRAFFIYLAITQLTRAFLKPKAGSGSGSGSSGQAVVDGVPEAPLAHPASMPGDLLDVRIYVTEHEEHGVLGPHNLQGRRPDWEYTSYVAGSKKDVYDSVSYEVVDSEDFLRRNATIQAVCVVRYAAGKSDEGVPLLRELALTYPLTEFREKRPEKKGQRLTESGGGGPAAAADEEEEEEDAASMAAGSTTALYWKGNLTVSLIPHAAAYPVGAPVQPPVNLFLRPDPETLTYAPFVFLQNFWLLEEEQVELNATSARETLSLGIRLHELDLWKAAVYLQMEQSWELQERLGLSTKSQSEELKRMFLETNPWFLGLTTAVSLLHTVFDMLAFRSDIGFWSKNESMKGLSARSILINCFCQVVIFLYLLENETSSMILLSNGLGLCIEFWKVTKATKVVPHRLLGVVPFFKIKDRDSYAKTETKAYDEEAGRYLSYVLYPLVLGYALYSLYYDEHRSWYSWVLSSLVGAVYTFGFILMCPQLYINYRMKSVAHLPWRQMTYKFLNTIIDDLFAFVIKMPTLHRLSVFRDDVIFLIQLYQRWIYRVDKTRANEFGYKEAEKEEEEKEEKEDKKTK